MPMVQKKMQCFDLVADRRVAVSRIIFVLNHGKMHLLDPHTVKYNRVRARPQDKFPPCRSLFIPCYNFGSGKTSGFLCAIRMTSSQGGIAKRQLWRLGIFQRHDCLQDDGVVNLFLFREGTCWSKIQRANKSQLIKLVEPCSVVISSSDIIPLTEVQRRGDVCGTSSDFSFSATHVGVGGCFEQATCPDFLYEAPAHIFKKNFGKNKCNISFATKCRSDFKYVEPGRDKNLGRGPIKKPKTQLRNCNSQSGQANLAVKSDLISQLVSDMSNWRMLESKKFGGKIPIPIYYCVHKKSFRPSEKHFLCPFQVKESISGTRQACGTKVFAKIPNDKKDALKEVTKQYLSPEVFDEKLRSLSVGTSELFVVDPREHPQGFVFSIVQDGEDLSRLGKIVFDNDEARIYKEERHGAFFDSSVKKGCVAFRGLPWLYETPLTKDELTCLETMHGSRDGCLRSRKSVDMDGFFSYTGPRSSGQASSTPIETSSHGHDLWNMKNSLPSFMTGTLLGRILCVQSDRMLELSGNVIMKAAMIFENTEDDREVGGYENICFHKIITMWFSSTMHTDNNDRSSTAFLSSMEQAFAGHLKDNAALDCRSTHDEVLHYLQRYRAINGNTFDNKNTICCWSVVSSETGLETHETNTERTEISFEHFFCCENLFFALDISSKVLKDEAVGGQYGGSILTRLITHGSSLPVCQMWELDEIIGAALYPDERGSDIPFAWGRSGGRKKKAK